MRLFLTGIGCKGIATLFYFGAIFFYTPPPDAELDDKQEVIIEGTMETETSKDPSINTGFNGVINDGFKTDDNAQFTRF